VAETLIYLDPGSKLNLQSQIRQKLVDGILSGTFPTGGRLPSSRKLAEQLGVARNTVVLAYEQLIEESFLESRERSGGACCQPARHHPPCPYPGPDFTMTQIKKATWQRR